MKKYKDGKIIDVSKNEAEMINKRAEKHRNSRKPSANDHEVRIKALEESVAALLAKENKEEYVHET